MSAYKEFSGKTVEEALRLAREDFGAGLEDLDFEILTPGSRGVLGMGAEPARIVAAPRAALGGAAPKREAAAATPLPPPTHDRDDRRRVVTTDRPGATTDPVATTGPTGATTSARRLMPPPRSRVPTRPRGPTRARLDRMTDRRARTTAASTTARPRRDDRGPRRDSSGGGLTASEAAEVAAARGSLAAERAELEAAEASPEALAAGKAILEQLMTHLGFEVKVEVDTGETSRLNVVGDGDERDALGALIGRKGERLSALQHLVNLMLSQGDGQLDPRARRRRGLPRPARAPAPGPRDPGRRPCRSRPARCSSWSRCPPSSGAGST